ncbi:MAG: Ig-like domain-containing protein, partial [Methanoregula sp.]|nr:Ig-like domain-containing protein [Methanoregula sp.]
GVQNEEGVSVIVGTLLLILITVIAAAGLAIMVSQMQKDEMNRQSHLAAVKNEKIEILNIGFANDRAAWNQTPLNIPTDQTWDNWSSITFTMANLNIEEVRVIGIAINDRYSANITTIEDTPAALRHLYNISGREYLNLQGTRSQRVQINFTDDFPATQYVPSGSQIRVRIMTSLYNNFEKNFKPPNPVFETHIETEDLGVTQRDVIVLDGSRSTADNTVVRWDWMVLDRANATLVNGDYWNDAANITTESGKLIRLNPKTPGPFSVKLKVTDDAGLAQISGAAEIPINSRFIPPSNLNAVFIPSPLSHVQASVKDINGNPLRALTVNFVVSNNPYGNLTLDRYYNTTDQSGTTFVNCTAGLGTVKVVYGKFTPIEIAVAAL